MLSDELRKFRSMVDDATNERGELHLSAMQTQMTKLVLLDLLKRANSLESCQVAGPARITEADMQTGKVVRLPIVPRPVPHSSGDGGSVA
ncbi:hypothetical protein [Stappia sp. ES.058]|uniref:hypothetical protein n=1 Tax=Stappia sp. ES.058 TaxID=1881061 RepID=UPI00087A72A7|nr:hypothetical protein [Stappia sp. ES.058]SDU09043.1 hypothetical protein SAMN05428979_1563 [Stappia sp. ES.058]